MSQNKNDYNLKKIQQLNNDCILKTNISHQLFTRFSHISHCPRMFSRPANRLIVSWMGRREKPLARFSEPPAAAATSSSTSNSNIRREASFYKGDSISLQRGSVTSCVRLSSNDSTNDYRGKASFTSPLFFTAWNWSSVTGANVKWVKEAFPMFLFQEKHETP